MQPARILVVDDEIIIARDLEARLLKMGYAVVGIASSGLEAIQLAGKHQPDLVLMDIVLKGEMDGIEAATEIRKRFQSPIIYVTAYTDDGTLRRAMITEPFGYIVKPFLEREVKANIEMALYKHRMEKRLRGIERWFYNALEGNAEGVILADPESRITVLNPVGESITAWPREMAVGRPLHDVLRLVNRSGEVVDCGQVAEGPVVCLSEDTLLLDRAGVEIPLDSMTSGVRDSENRLAGSISVFRDASGRRFGALVPLVAEISLAASEATSIRDMLQYCVESVARNLNTASARIWSYDARNDMLCLEAKTGIDRLTPEETLPITPGKALETRIAAERAPIILRELNSDVQSIEGAWAARENLVTYAGFPILLEEQLLGVVSVYSRYNMGPGALEALEAITQTIAVGVQRMQAEEQLRQSQKMEAVGQLAGGIAHDFNNLLMVVLGYSETLLENEALDEETHQLLGEIHRAGERAAGLTRQLLTFSRRQVAAPVLLELNETVRGMENLLRRTLGEDISFAMSLEDGLHAVLADAGLLEQVLLNLVVNARDAMPRGGRLHIETRNVTLDAAYAARRALVKPGPYVMLAVRDSGVGIAPQHLPHVFEPFFTTKAQGRGTGLGLSTVYGIVRQAGGHLDVESEVGTGSIFRVYLPAQYDTPQPSAERKELSLHTGDETVLVVEDDPSVRDFIVTSLRRAGYNVLEAASGPAALAIAKSYEGCIHLLLTDVVMPGMAGRELADRWQPLRPESVVVFMSGYTDDAVVRSGVLQAEMNFLQKPFTPVVLTSRIRELLGKRQGDA